MGKEEKKKMYLRCLARFRHLDAGVGGEGEIT
jgi:hypothetical protein